MKKYILFLTVLFAGLKSYAQDIIPFGSIEYDGYGNITKGAYYASRPEAKLIYEGQSPAGYTVYVLNQDCFVRFAKNENNKLDINYIVFPKGSIVYKNNITGEYFAAVCGNRIIYLKPVVEVQIVERPLPPPPPQDDPVSLPPPSIVNKPTVTHDTVSTITYIYVIEKGQQVCYQRRTFWDFARNIWVNVNIAFNNGGGWQQMPTNQQRMPGGIYSDPRSMPQGINNTSTWDGNNGGITANGRNMPRGIDYRGY